MKTNIEKKGISAPEVLNEPIEYHKSFSRGIKVNIGEATLLFISGTASVDENGNTFCPHDFDTQVKRTFTNLTALLQSEGATWYDVVKTGCFLKSMKYYNQFNEFRNAFYKELKLDPFPASFCIEAHLCRPDLLVEIELTAIIHS